MTAAPHEAGRSRHGWKAPTPEFAVRAIRRRVLTNAAARAVSSPFAARVAWMARKGTRFAD